MIAVAARNVTVDLLRKPALGKHGFVEETQARGHQAEQRRRAREDPEGRCPEGRRRVLQPFADARRPWSAAVRDLRLAQQQDRRRGDTTSPRATWAHAVRQPAVAPLPPTATNAPQRTRSAARSRRPSAAPTSRSNDLPTAVMLATDSALWPIARVASTSTNSIAGTATEPAHGPHDGAEQQRERERRDAQAHAIEHPADRQADRGADQRRPQVDRRVGDAIELQIASIGSVIRPSPCVRPGNVASITMAATTTLIQPAARMREGRSAVRYGANPCQKRTPKLTPAVRGAPISPMNPDGAKLG